MHWKFCSYLYFADAFAYVNKSSPFTSQGYKIITSSDYAPTEFTLLLRNQTELSNSDHVHRVRGIQLTRQSEIECFQEPGLSAFVGSQYYTLTTVIECDTSNFNTPVIESQGNGTCSPIVTVSHATGCPLSVLASISVEREIDVGEFKISEESSVMLGILFVFMGAAIALFGRRIFPYIASTAGSLLILDFIIYGSLIFGFSNTTYGLLLSVFIALALSIIGGIITKRVLNIGIVVICIIQGFAVGFLIYGVAIFFAPVW